ncbi:hypothetical protein ACES2L_01015 [Bdellovibrio bacteriovorus]
MNIEMRAVSQPEILNDAFAELSELDPSEAMLICNPRTLSMLASGLLANRIQPFRTGKLHLNNIADNFHPIYTPPRAANNQALICNIANSFVFSAPKFIQKDHRLIFHFKLDINKTNQVRGFQL